MAMTPGDAIRTAREAAGLTIPELAKLAGISVDYLTRIEAGTAAPPRLEVCIALAHALGTDVATLRPCTLAAASLRQIARVVVRDAGGGWAQQVPRGPTGYQAHKAPAAKRPRPKATGFCQWADCRKPLDPMGRTDRIYSSTVCKAAAAWRRGHPAPVPVRTCAHCGGDMEPGGAGQLKLYCNSLCKGRAKDRRDRARKAAGEEADSCQS